LDDRSALFDSAGGVDVGHLELYQITPPQFAVDGEVEESWVAVVLGYLKTNANGQDILGHQSSLLADDTALVSGGSAGSNGRQVRNCHGGYADPTPCLKANPTLAIEHITERCARREGLPRAEITR
jgi:hypothetical protein